MTIAYEKFRTASCVLAVAVTLFVPGLATASSIFTFGLSSGDAADPGSVLSYSISGTDTTIVKEVDGFTAVVAAATAAGTEFAGASLVEYDGVVSPPTEIGRYDYESVLFTSQSFGGFGGLETFSFSADRVTFTPAEGSVPEPGTWLMLLTGACAVAGRRRRSQAARSYFGGTRAFSSSNQF